MIKHSTGIIHRDELPRGGMERVVTLPAPIDTARYGDLYRQHLDTLAKAAADQYLNVKVGTVDNAKLNDIVLRAAMLFTIETQMNKDLEKQAFDPKLNAFYDKIFAALDRKGVPKGDRDALEYQLGSLRSSVYQLSSFVRRERAKNPNNFFGTSPWLDVFYGYDLMRAEPEWAEDEQRLNIRMTAYQAKASGAPTGVKQEEIQGLPDTYKGQKGRAERELSFDPDWFANQLVRTMKPNLRQSLELGLSDVNKAREILGSLSVKTGTPFERWTVAHVRSRIADRLASGHRTDVSGMPGIAMSGTSVPFRFIVDTPMGIQVLDDEQARQYRP